MKSDYVLAALILLAVALLALNWFTSPEYICLADDRLSELRVIEDLIEERVALLEGR